MASLSVGQVSHCLSIEALIASSAIVKYVFEEICAHVVPSVEEKTVFLAFRATGPESSAWLHDC